jgi:hypothetical protein
VAVNALATQHYAFRRACACVQTPEERADPIKTFCGFANDGTIRLHRGYDHFAFDYYSLEGLPLPSVLCAACGTAFEPIPR